MSRLRRRSSWREGRGEDGEDEEDEGEDGAWGGGRERDGEGFRREEIEERITE